MEFKWVHRPTNKFENTWPKLTRSSHVDLVYVLDTFSILIKYNILWYVQYRQRRDKHSNCQ